MSEENRIERWTQKLLDFSARNRLLNMPAKSKSVLRLKVDDIAKVEDSDEQRSAPTRQDFVLGVRPEFIKISDDGIIEGEVFSAMPTGMETTVKIRVGNFLLTAVVFGGVVYKIGQKVRLSFSGDNIMLFSRENGRLIVNGSVEMERK